jgi:hypothetical protein
VNETVLCFPAETFRESDHGVEKLFEGARIIESSA